MKKVLKFVVYVLPVIAGVFLLKKAKDMPKDKVLTLGKGTIETIRASKNTKTVGTTKEVLQCINNTKTLNNNITLNI